MYNFCSTQVNVPVTLQMTAIRLGLAIPEKDLAYLKGREKEPHVTIRYGLQTVNPAAVRDAVKDLPFFNVAFGKFGIFPSKGEGDVLYVSIADSVGAGGLVNLRKRLDQFSAQDAGEWPNYQAHMTIAYLVPGAGDYLKGVACDLSGQVMEVSNILYCERNGNQHECSLRPPSVIQRPADLYRFYNGNQGV